MISQNFIIVTSKYFDWKILDYTVVLENFEFQLLPQVNIMAKAHISATNATDKTIRAIDRKREREKRFILNKARDNADEFALRVTQRLIDRDVLEINSVQDVRDAFIKQLRALPEMEEFDIQLKVAPIRTLVPDPNILSLYLTGYIIEDLIENPAIEDVFGEDLDIYRAIDSIFKVLRPQQ